MKGNLVAEMIDLHYTLSDGTSGFCQVTSDFPEDQRESYLEYVVSKLEENLHYA
jgi:hypothetical protein